MHPDAFDSSCLTGCPRMRRSPLRSVVVHSFTSLFTARCRQSAQYPSTGSQMSIVHNKTNRKMMYFKNCRTLDEIKAQYKILAKQHHPDCGGNTETMQAINAEYADACANAIRGENLTEEDTEEQIRMSEEYRAVIEKIMPLAGINIELVGNWIWVTGSTYPVRKELKEAGLFFASRKVAWYYRAEEYKTKGSDKTLDEIRAKYGSETVNPSQRNRAIKQHS